MIFKGLLSVFASGFLFAGSSYFLCTNLTSTSSELDLKNPNLVLITNDSLQKAITPKSIDIRKSIGTFDLKSDNSFGWKSFTIVIPDYSLNKIVVPPGFRLNSLYTFKYSSAWIKLYIFRDQDSNDSKKGQNTNPSCFISWALVREDSSELAKQQNIEDFIKQYILGDSEPLIFDSTTKKKKSEKRPNYFCHKINIDNLIWINKS